MIPSTKRQRLIGLAVLVVTFLAGGFAGAAIRVVTADPPPARQDRDGDRDDDGRREDRRFPYEHLGIDGEQRAQIEAVFTRNHQAQQAVWQEVKPRFDEIVDSTRAEVNRLLTPEQRERFTEYRKRRRERQSSERVEATRDSVRN